LAVGSKSIGFLAEFAGFQIDPLSRRERAGVRGLLI